MRSYALAPKDPVNTLSLGLALLHASMQRKTDNRHLQVVQVMRVYNSFFLRLHINYSLSVGFHVYFGVCQIKWTLSRVRI